MYRKAMNPIKALEVLKSEVEQDRLSARFFIDFAYSLAYSPSSGVCNNYSKVLKSWNLGNGD